MPPDTKHHDRVKWLVAKRGKKSARLEEKEKAGKEGVGRSGDVDEDVWRGGEEVEFAAVKKGKFRQMLNWSGVKYEKYRYVYDPRKLRAAAVCGFSSVRLIRLFLSACRYFLPSPVPGHYHSHGLHHIHCKLSETAVQWTHY